MPTEHGRSVVRPLVDDPALPALSAVLDPEAVSACLRKHLPAGLQDPRGMEVRLLRHHPGKRCVLELRWWGDECALSAIAKAYAGDRSDVYRVMEEIRLASLGPRDTPVPRPLAYVEHLRLLLQERVEGRPATEALLSDEAAERGAAAERCATWLAAFHGLALRTGPRVHLGDRLLSAERWVGRLAALGAPFADKARELLAGLESAPALPGAEPCTIHGDYSHHQVLFADGRTVAVDWDKHRLADPADDVARFVVGLQRLALRRRGSMRALDGAADVFLKTYLAEASEDPSPRVAFHRAAICLEHAKHDVHKRSPAWAERAVAALDEGVRVLAEAR